MDLENRTVVPLVRTGVPLYRVGSKLRSRNTAIRGVIPNVLLLVEEQLVHC